MINLIKLCILHSTKKWEDHVTRIIQHPVFSSMQTDFIVMDKENPVEIEVGGRNKKKKQIKNIQSACIFKDGIETGHANVVPLYLAGFLY